MRFFTFTPSLILLFGLIVPIAHAAQKENHAELKSFNHLVMDDHALDDGPALAEPIAPTPDALRPSIDDVPLTSDITRSEGETRIDILFALLKKTQNSRAAQGVANDIWSEWFKSGSASIDLLLQWSNEAALEQKYNIALDFLDQVILLRPNYAEGWNRRATLHYTMLNFNKSMADVRRVLDLEPRHFGALSGLATMLERNGNKKAALKAWEQLLLVYPAMPRAQEAFMRLLEDTEGDPA